MSTSEKKMLFKRLDLRVFAPVDRSPFENDSPDPKLRRCLCNWGSLGMRARATSEMRLSENRAGW